jgi:RNA 3'-terminal phosphate cyclase (ATP)
LIDGSIGEAGGQILRTSIALSSLLQKPIKIINIRKGRKKSGLMRQHLTGVRVAGEFCSAEIKGLELGSTNVEYFPTSFNFSSYKRIDIESSGSISLLLQTLTPLLIYADKSVTLEIRGGTAGLGSPTIHFLKYVTFPILSKLGLKLPEVEVIKEGFYPRGGGIVRIKTYPVKKLNSVELTERGKVKCIKGISVVGSLPKDVVERQTNAAIKILKDYGFDDICISSQVVNTFSPGTSITLWAECENSILGSDNIGKKGVRAEKIGEDCARELIKSIESKAALDKFMADQIIPFLALASGESEVSIEEFTQHVNTNMLVCEKILGIKFEKEDKKIKVKGIGFELS